MERTGERSMGSYWDLMGSFPRASCVCDLRSLSLSSLTWRSSARQRGSKEDTKREED